MHLLPRPRAVQERPGAFTLTADLAIAGDPAWAAVVRRLLTPGTGLDLPPRADGALVVRHDETLPTEGYRLDVSPERITIAAAGTTGVNWATQTLRQLLGESVYRQAPTGAPLTAACVHIDDAPRFGWRGVMLDVGRHFRPLHDLYRFVDLLAAHKYNVFHLHLTDDQGWRFASATHPRLQELASWRTETRRHLQDFGDGTPHGGCYTHDQLRSLVRYAADRGVTVMPELEFPGHVRAVLNAYPELGNDPARRLATATTFGIFPEVLNLSEMTMEFVLDLYTELLDVFPSPYVHVGGDECPREEWLASAEARRLAGERGLPGPEHLQRWFTRSLRDWLAARGRKLVGWDEICDEGPLDGAVAMVWRDARHGQTAAAAGMDVVLAPLSHTYFDHYPSDDDAEAYAIGGLTTTEQAYSLDPLAGIDPAHLDRVLGTQCQLWTEYMPSTRRVDYMMFPRACAHSEVAWSDPTGRTWDEFRPRLEGHLRRLAAMGVDYRPETGPLPWQEGGTGALRRPAQSLEGAKAH